MIKKIIYFVVVVVLVSCGSSRNKKNPVSVTKPVTVVIDNGKVVPTSTDSPTSSSEPKSGTTDEELVATSKVMTNAESIALYVNTFKEIAKKNMKEYGIPASITLAQGILESGAGRGRLSIEANNHFGIKCHKEWNGPSIRHDDDSSQECFRKYNDPAESYKDHSLFLTSRSWYKPLFSLAKDDYEGWAKGLKKSGYATDPKYPAKLIAIIERYQLNLFDSEVLNKKQEQKTENTPIILTEKLYTVQQGDTLYSLSKKYNVSVEELKKINDLRDNALSIGQKIKLK